MHPHIHVYTQSFLYMSIILHTHAGVGNNSLLMVAILDLIIPQGLMSTTHWYTPPSLDWTDSML